MRPALINFSAGLFYILKEREVRELRILKFIVDKQIIKQDPSCDFSGLIPGTEGYLKAEFSFSKEWKDCPKVARFFSRMGKEYPPQALTDGKSCIIPAEALKKKAFGIQVIGKKDGLKITTDKIVVIQNGGKK